MNNKTHNDWDDFEVLKSPNTLSGSALYESYKSLKAHFKELPKSDLIARGWISNRDDIASLTDLFRDIHSARGGTLFRRSGTPNLSLSLIWLSKVRAYAEARVASGEIARFTQLGPSDLNAIAKISPNVQAIGSLASRLAEKGIVLVYCRSLPGMKVDGAAFKLSSGHPVVGMSLRYSRLDYFWFTLMHELAHVSLHLPNDPILDDLDADSDSDIEITANRLAKESFVPRRIWRNCEPKYDKSPEAISRFAKSVGVHRSIIAGMLRKELGDYASYSNIVNEHDVREILLNGN